VPDSRASLPAATAIPFSFILPAVRATVFSPFATTGASLTVNANLLVHREVIPSFFLLFSLPFSASSSSHLRCLTQFVFLFSLSLSLSLWPLRLFSTPPSYPFSLVGSLAFLSAAETTDDRVSGRIFPMAVIAHVGESRPSQSGKSLYPLTESLRAPFLGKQRDSRLEAVASLCTASRID